MGFLSGKKALIVGIASNRSIAYGIARAMHREGAELAFSYANDRLKSRVEKFAAEFESDIVLPCDVASDAEISDLFVQLGQRWQQLDALVHSVAFAPRERWPVTTLKTWIERAFVSHTTSVPTASLQWPKPPGR